MIFMALFDRHPVFEIDAERGSEQGMYDVMDGDRIARQEQPLRMISQKAWQPPV
jgi:hypothetical protein